MQRFLWIFNLGLKQFDDSETRLPGWGIPMFFFSLMAVWCMSCFSLDLSFLWISIFFSVIGILDTVVTYFLLRRHVRNLRRVVGYGILNPRLFVETAAISLTLSFSIGIFAISGGVPGIGQWQDVLFRAAMQGCQVLFEVAFWLTATAMLLGIATDRPMRGSSFELLAFFFWCSCGTSLLRVLPPMNGAAIGMTLAAASIGILLIAAVLKLVEKLHGPDLSRSMHAD